MGEEADVTEVSPGRPSRRRLVLLIAPIVVITVMGTMATAFTPALAARHPLLLIALDARNRFLVLAREVDLVPFVVVALLRRTISDPLFYLLGRYYGDGAVRWLETKAGGGDVVRWTESAFQRASYPMVFLFPGAVVCALAGATGMRPAAFLATNIAGTLTAILAVRRFSAAIASPVDAVLDFFNRNLVVTTAVSVVLVALSVVLNRVQGKLEVGSVAELEQQLEEGDAGAVGDPGAGSESEPQ
jgi:membrane protein DedA with SNARE-associated domain